MPCKCVCRADQRLSRKSLPGLPLAAMRRRTSVRACISVTRRAQHEHPLMAACPGCRVGRQDQGMAMTLINIRNLGVTLGAPLFSKLDLSINAGDRIGLVAANGRGKSTLLRCIAGMAEPGEGEITRSRGLSIGHVEQDVPSTLADTAFHAAVLDMLPLERRASEGWRVDVALDSLEVPEALRQRPLKQLSGGWQRMAMLARVVVAEVDILLLDEPTNHLDLT